LTTFPIEMHAKSKETIFLVTYSDRLTGSVPAKAVICLHNEIPSFAGM